MSSQRLRDLLRDGGAGYEYRATTITLPGDLFQSLSSNAQLIIRHEGNSWLDGKVSPVDFVPDRWDPAAKWIVAALPMTERVDLCAFLSAVMHECQHHLDLMRTPFGLSVHERAAREYLAFERLTPYIVSHPDILDRPLADWILSLGPGTSEEGMLTSPETRQAEIDLRGVIAFDEFRRGTPARNVRNGSRNLGTDKLVIRGHSWKLQTVNELWPTINKGVGGYLSPTDVVEGRALAMCLLYLIDLMGPTAATIATLRAFVEEYYSEQGAETYTSLLEIHAGRPVVEIWDLEPREVRGICHDAMWSSWFALHSGVGAHEKDANYNVSMRCLLAAALFYRSGGNVGEAGLDAIQGVDSLFAKVGGPTGEMAIANAIDRCDLVLELYVKNIADPTMRAWFQTVLRTIGSELVRRSQHGYRCLSGTPDDGNSLRSARTDFGANEVMSFAPGEKRVAEWFRIRRHVVTKMADADSKRRELRDFFQF